MVAKAVIVLAHGGARTLAGRAIDPRKVAAVKPEAWGDTARRLGEAMTRFVREPPPGMGPLLEQSAALEELEQAFRRAASRRET